MADKNKKICVLGLGYIGLPTASMFATHGYKVHGVDVNTHVIETLKSGKLHIEEPGLDTVVKAALTSKNLNVDVKPEPADVFIIAVPTPYNKSDSGVPTADMSFVLNALKSILPLLKKGNLVILESTSPPGTTRELIVPLIESKGFKVGADIGVSYCPERVIPGLALKELIGNDRVVGGIDPHWAQETKKLYKSFVSGEIFTTDPTVAEMTKVLENTFRDVNIALANEVAKICEKLGINVWEVIQLANRHPRVNVHKPGPGVGGHCISVDPWFLVEKFPNEAKLIHKARQTNDAMPQYVVSLMERLLEGKKKCKVAILGLAYKGNVDDIRESPSLSVIEHIKEKYPDFTLVLCDPHVRSKDVECQNIKDAFSGADIALLLTAHDEFKHIDPVEMGPLMRHRIILDAHNILKSERWISAGFKFHTLGTPV